MARVGLLPLYIELYDEACPEMRPEVEAFYERIAGELRRRELEVCTRPICRRAEEFAAAVAAFEELGADALVTLHLAYSPSLEAERALRETRLPILVLDTTPDYAFDFRVEAGRISYNHGIHGVQDMCSLLVRYGVKFEIFAGHWERSDVLDRLARAALAASMATRMRTARVGIIGEPFRGMGDFALPAPELEEKLGLTVVPYDMEAGAYRVGDVLKWDVEREMVQDFDGFRVAGSLDREQYFPSGRMGLALRRWIEEEQLTAFTMNFLEAGKPGFPVVPFAEASKQMDRGVGYAGEGDVLTAALVGALLGRYPRTTFAEMFCPDWRGGSVFFSHMGEFNLKVSARMPRLAQIPFPFTPAPDPVVLLASFRAGQACFVNLAPGPEGGFTWIVAPGRMLEAPDDALPGTVAGWFKPRETLGTFLEAYSRQGGTHHGALVYDADVQDLAMFGHMMGWNTRIIG